MNSIKKICVRGNDEAAEWSEKICDLTFSDDESYYFIEGYNPEWNYPYDCGKSYEIPDDYEVVFLEEFISMQDLRLPTEEPMNYLPELWCIKGSEKLNEWGCIKKDGKENSNSDLSDSDDYQYLTVDKDEGEVDEEDAEKFNYQFDYNSQMPDGYTLINFATFEKFFINKSIGYEIY